jgi:hypothetical protein
VPATIEVTSLADSGAGTLRAAIEQANLDAAQDTIDFGPSVTGTITLSTALPNLSTNMIIVGPGPSSLTLARSGVEGTPGFGILNAVAGIEASISGLTISGDRGGFSAGISNAGTLTLTDCTLSGNSASGGSAVSGISNAGTLMLTDCTLSGNSASGGGAVAGITNIGTLTLTFCTLSGNSADGGGAFGGIANFATLTLTDCTLSGNSASGGSAVGGILNGGTGTLTLTDCTLSGNSASGGGAVGGILNGGTLTLTACTLSGNSADGGSSVSGIVSSGGKVTATTSLFGNASMGNLEIGNGAQFVSGGHNLFFDAPSATLDPTDLIDTNPLLGPLANNGGPTLTQALLPGSPAIDAGIAVPGVTTDQRGVPRSQGAAPDIGAFELATEPFVQLEPDSATEVVGTSHEITATVLDPDLRPLPGIPVMFRLTAGPNAGATGTTDPADGRTDADGQVRFAYVGAGGPGTDTIVATAQLASGVRIAAPGASVVWTFAPTVVVLQRFGIHRHPTTLVVTFSKPLNATTAESRANYLLVSAGPDHRFGTRDDGAIGISSIQYDAASRTVTIRPTHRLPLHRRFQLTILGTPPSGLKDTAGFFLDGAGTGKEATNYVVIITDKLLVPPIVHKTGKSADVAQRLRHR